MSGGGQRERARRPEDLGRFFVARANPGDVEGLVAVYEPDAVLVLPTGEVVSARRQSDGTWLWMINQSNVLG